MSGTDGPSHAVSEARPQGSGKDGPRMLMQGSARRGGSVIYLWKTETKADRGAMESWHRLEGSTGYSRWR